MNNILFVVDDSDTNLAIVESALVGHCTVITIASVEQMFKLLERIRPEVIMLDINMPELDLNEVISIINNKDIPLVCTSNTRTAEIESKCFQLGAADFIVKPFNPQGLLSRLRLCIKPKENKPTILIIDDVPLIINALGDILKPAYHVVAAKSGEAGLKQAEKQNIDLIFLDINMPLMSGFDVLRALKESEHTRNIPVIFLTGSDEPGDQIEGLAGGAVDYIRKPFTREQVLQRVGLYVKRNDL